MYKVTQDVWNSSSVEIYLQTGVQSTESNMVLELFCQVVKEVCFTVLRTQEQLGRGSFKSFYQHCLVGLKLGIKLFFDISMK